MYSPSPSLYANLTFTIQPRGVEEGWEETRRCKLIRKPFTVLEISAFTSRENPRKSYIFARQRSLCRNMDVARNRSNLYPFSLFPSFSSPFQGRREPIKENCLINDRTSDGQNRLETERQRRYSFSRYNPPHYFYRPAAMSIGEGRGRRRSLSLSLSRDSNFRGKLRGFSLEMLRAVKAKDDSRLLTRNATSSPFDEFENKI